jgi:hypothetical protein
MHFIILTTAAISVLVFVSQSASALPVRDSHRESSQLSKRQTGDAAGSGDSSQLLGLLGIVLGSINVPIGIDPSAPPSGPGTATPANGGKWSANGGSTG